MSTRTINMTEPVQDYLISHSLRDHPVLAELRKATASLEMARMQISPEQGQFMQFMARAIGAKRCIEVGVFTGYSALAVALALPDSGKIVACDVSDEWTSIGRTHWEKAGVTGKIDLRLAPATQTLDAMLAAGEAGKYDFAFIDADKGAYLDYYERILKLLRLNGIMLVDNTLWSGRVADPANNEPDTVALRRFNDFVHKDERVGIAMLPVGDGLTLLRKR
ncbi:class I SAM-dependent methyltransferase [Usitatibacter palustris]|uniref:tRNA 5-hydroxyuridine methyltransferase n=1 Tax=Usitatibacter palustris TaxID=2732487 RepID=A0A6M4HDI6_9PROT|nr:class I SAM-dependent methyltransferase [Usitatibacter palustris]QJR16798.1 tRNA 5-hydroxyuridine methyltransferase [Usitatibacter palustris]